jgi:hypothetical protein
MWPATVTKQKKLQRLRAIFAFDFDIFRHKPVAAE